MKLRLDLSRHCVETAVKRCHEAAIARYFKDGNEREAVDAELVLLEAALTAFDFPALRSRWPALAGGDEGLVFLAWKIGGMPCLRFADRCVVPPASEESDT